MKKVTHLSFGNLYTLITKKHGAGLKGHQNNPQTPGIGPCQERAPAPQPAPPPFPQVLMVYQKCMIKVFDRS